MEDTRAPTEQRRQMEDTRATHNGNPQLLLALHQNRHQGKENECTGFVEEQSATTLGWEEKSTPPPRRGVAPIGVTNVDKTIAMPAIGFPWRFPTSTGTIRPTGRVGERCDKASNDECGTTSVALTASMKPGKDFSQCSHNHGTSR